MPRIQTARNARLSVEQANEHCRQIVAVLLCGPQSATSLREQLPPFGMVVHAFLSHSGFLYPPGLAYLLSHPSIGWKAAMMPKPGYEKTGPCLG
jgi:hypothetical protein